MPDEKNQIRKIKRMKLKIKVLTGLRIGGPKETYEIGDVDNPVIKGFHFKRDINTKIPYIPGSSIKGRLRSLLELKYGAYKNDGGVSDVSVLDSITDENVKKKVELLLKMFGVGAKDKKGEDFGITRLIFGDLYPTEETIEKWENLKKEDKTDDFGTEIKVENVINRVTGAAQHPRRQERVIPGSEFEGEIRLIVFNNDNEEEMVKLLKEGIELLNKTYLGSSGSRGYGRVEATIEPEESSGD